MKKMISMLFVLLVYALTSYGTSFKLSRGGLGPTYGPFEFKEGEKIQIDDWILTLIIDSTESEEISPDDLSAIILPHVAFDNESINGCFQKMNTMIHTQAPDKAHVNIVLAAELQQEDKDSIYSFRQNPLINIDLQDVSALSVIQTICQQAELKYKLTDAGAFIYRTDPSPTPTPAEESPAAIDPLTGQ